MATTDLQRWRSAHAALIAITIALVVLGFWVIRHYLTTLVFASWFATLVWPWRVRLVAKTKRPALSALGLTTGICVSMLAPLIGAGVLVGVATSEWVASGIAALRSGNLQEVWSAVFGGRQEQSWGDFVREGARMIPSVLTSVGAAFQSLVELVISVFLFVVGLYYFLLEGDRARRALERASPLSLRQTRVLLATYAATGRGMLVGVFLVIIIHAVTAVVGYAIVGVPRALELGVLTALAGLVPGIGTALVWAPLAMAMMVSDHVNKGIGVVCVGLVVGMMDNLARPYLAKLGHVPLPTLALFAAIFGGIALFGPSGLLLGPLVVALAKAALELYIEEKERPPPPRNAAAAE